MIAVELAEWATAFVASRADEEMASRALADTLAVTLAARTHPIARLVKHEAPAVRLTALAHVLDFDDLHLESTAHVSAVCVMATAVSDGLGRAYLAGAGVMARMGSALGWSHYASGWHATCTAGAFGAAAAAAVAYGLDAGGIARALALAVPGASGVQRAFGTDAKSLQVGFATDAGVRAARLARAGASCDVGAVDEWLALVGGRGDLDTEGPAVPGGLAVKVFPCCYALQRPIVAARQLADLGVRPSDVAELVVRAPAATLQPLIHHRPVTGLEAKFSLEYGIAAALLDPYPGFSSFEDAAVRRPAATALLSRVRVDASAGGSSLLDGALELEAVRHDGSRCAVAVDLPPGAPGGGPFEDVFSAKVADCGADVPDIVAATGWTELSEVLHEETGAVAPAAVG